MKYSLLLLSLFTSFLLSGGTEGHAQAGGLNVTTRANFQINTELAVINAGKRATVLVDTPGSNGSAFCIDNSGIFVTNAHVVDDFPSVKVVLFPGEKEQKVVNVRVSHYDEENDLAVLIADPPLQTQAPRMPALTALPLGDSSALFETTPIAVFGFPFGTDLALDEREMPGVTVTTGRITALRKLQGILKEIQLDAATNPGNSGGPVIDSRGRVVGVIHAKVDGAQGVNFAIPTTPLKELLSSPEIHLKIPDVPWAKRNADQTFTIQVTPFQLVGVTPALAGGNFDLDFAVGVGPLLRKLSVVRTSRDGDAYTEFRVTGAFVRPGSGRTEGLKYKLTLRQNGKTVTVRQGDITISRPQFNGGTTPFGGFIPRTGGVGGFGSNFGGNRREPEPSHPVVSPLNNHWYQYVRSDHNLTWSEAKAAAAAMTYNGLKGHLATITSEPEQQFIANMLDNSFHGRDLVFGGDLFWVGAQQQPDGAEPDGGWRWVTGEPWRYTNWAAGEPNDAGNEDLLQLRQDGTWNDGSDNTTCIYYLVEFEPANGVAGPLQPADAPQVEGDKTIIELPAPASAAVAGGGGRFLLLYLKMAEKVAVFDAKEKKIVRYIPAPGSNTLIAASQEKVVILLADQNILQRWNLQTGQREQSLPIPDDKAVISMAMGSASAGPLAMIRGDNFSLLDLATLEPMGAANSLKLNGRFFELAPNQPLNISASPDGSSFAITGRLMRILAREANQLSLYPVEGYNLTAMPSFDGRWWFTSGGIFTGEGKRVVADQLLDNGGPTTFQTPYQTLIPSSALSYFVGLKSRVVGTGWPTSRREQVDLTIYSANDRRALATLGGLEELVSSRIGTPIGPRTDLPLAKRVYYLPEYNSLVTIGHGMDSLVIRHLDLKRAMSQAGNKFLFVASVPPRKVVKGSLFKYQIDVQSQAGNTKYKTESGPTGLTVTPTGLVQWKVPATFTEPEATILIAISDASGQELYHSFKVQIE